MINTNRYKLMANVGAVVDVVPDANGAWVKWEDCQARVAELEAGIEAALAIIPGAVRVREGGAHEDLLASLAVTASKLNHSR